VSVSLQLAAFALANYLMGASPGAQPFWAAAFLLGIPGHQRAGAANPRELHRRTRLLAKGLNTVLRTKMGLDYDPLDIVEFNSFDEFIRKKPRGEAIWHDIMVVTHGAGEAPPGVTGQISFGRESFTVDGSGGDLLDAITANATRVKAFRKGFYEPGNITLVACNNASTGFHVAIYIRDLFGTRGLIKFPVKNVDFTSLGGLATPVDPEDPGITLRRLTAAEWHVVPRKDDIIGSLPPQPDSMDIDDFFRD
jgi:hypothetical protein